MRLMGMPLVLQVFLKQSYYNSSTLCCTQKLNSQPHGGATEINQEIIKHLVFLYKMMW